MSDLGGLGKRKQGAGNKDSTSIALKSIDRDLSLGSGTQDITGFGFNPTSAIVVVASKDNVDPRASWGFCDRAAFQRCIHQLSGGNMSQNNTNVIEIHTIGGNAQYGVLSYITDGVRITWTKTGSPTGNGRILIFGIR